MRYEFGHITADSAAGLVAQLNTLGQQGWHVVGWYHDRHDAMAHGALLERHVEVKAQPVARPPNTPGRR